MSDRSEISFYLILGLFVIKYFLHWIEFHTGLIFISFTCFQFNPNYISYKDGKWKKRKRKIMNHLTEPCSSFFITQEILSIKIIITYLRALENAVNQCVSVRPCTVAEHSGGKSSSSSGQLEFFPLPRKVMSSGKHLRLAHGIVWQQKRETNSSNSLSNLSSAKNDLLFLQTNSSGSTRMLGSYTGFFV